MRANRNTFWILGLAPTNPRSPPEFLICVRQEIKTPMPELSAQFSADRSNTICLWSCLRRFLTVVSSNSRSRHPRTKLPAIITTVMPDPISLVSNHWNRITNTGFRVSFAIVALEQT